MPTITKAQEARERNEWVERIHTREWTGHSWDRHAQRFIPRPSEHHHDRGFIADHREGK